MAVQWCTDRQTPAFWPLPSHAWKSPEEPWGEIYICTVHTYIYYVNKNLKSLILFLCIACSDIWWYFSEYHQKRWLQCSKYFQSCAGVKPSSSSSRWCRRRRWRCAGRLRSSAWAPCSRCSPPAQSAPSRAERRSRSRPDDPTAR